MSEKHTPGLDANPIVQRLHGRIEQSLRHGRVKDPELMMSAVEILTEMADAAQCLLDDMGEPEDGAQANLMNRLRATVIKAIGQKGSAV